MMKLAWWKIVTILLLAYTVIAGLIIPLQPSLSGVSNANIGENAQVDVYVYNGGLKLPSKKDDSDNVNGIKAWTVDSKDEKKAVCWQAQAFVISSQKIRLQFGAAPYLKSKSLDLVMEFNHFRDTLQNAFYYSLSANAPSGVLRVDKVSADQNLQKPFGFSNREVLNETVRNLFFHVPIWFAMMLVAFLGMMNSIQFLRNGKLLNDLKAEKYMKVSVLMGILGLLTGSLWARFTWGTWWVFDVKLNGAAIAVLIYVAYLVLRSGITDEIQRARTSAVYSIFAFVLMIVFVMIVPRIYDSLHPGNGGNPGANVYDLNGTLRLVFYPAVVAWMGLAVWISDLNIRFQRIVNKEHENI